MQSLIAALNSGRTLNADDTATLFAAMLTGKLSEDELRTALLAWRQRGETAVELYAGAMALRERATTVDLPDGTRPVIDNCGTGGDGAGSFNISTAAAIVAASAGARVAKHGNRSVSSKCGSADLLFAAGVPESLSSAAAGELLHQTGFTFFYAPNFHPALKALAPVRRALGVRTVFNLLGPLANPIAPEFQLIGVGAKAYLEPMATTLAKLGVRKALVVHSRDGLDEISPAALTDGILVDGAQLTRMVIDPSTLPSGVEDDTDEPQGRPTSVLTDLAGGDATVNLAILERLLADNAPGVAAAVALNAGAVLWLFGTAATLAEGVALAHEQISGKLAQRYFSHWLATAKALASH